MPFVTFHKQITVINALYRNQEFYRGATAPGHFKVISLLLRAWDLMKISRVASYSMETNRSIKPLLLIPPIKLGKQLLGKRHKLFFKH